MNRGGCNGLYVYAWADIPTSGCNVFSGPVCQEAERMKSKFVRLLLLFIGGVSFVVGSYRLFSLFDKSNQMEHTVGVVTHLKTERTYRHRKIYYERTARIEYETKLYRTHVRMRLHNPFVFRGSEISLWYNPDRTEEVTIPFEEGFIWGSLWAFGALCFFLGIVNCKISKI